VRDFALVKNTKTVDAAAADAALMQLEVDHMGLDSMDRRYMACIAENYAGGPAGVETIAAALSEQRDVLEDVVEPYLIQTGFIVRTPRGRMISDAGYRHLGLAPPPNAKDRQMALQIDLPVDEEA
jgi:Holliday junction DNA helicase RuvB